MQMLANAGKLAHSLRFKEKKGKKRGKKKKEKLPACIILVKYADKEKFSMHA